MVDPYLHFGAKPSLCIRVFNVDRMGWAVFQQSKCTPKSAWIMIMTSANTKTAF